MVGSPRAALPEAPTTVRARIDDLRDHGDRVSEQDTKARHCHRLCPRCPLDGTSMSSETCAARSVDERRQRHLQHPCASACASAGGPCAASSRRGEV